MRLKKYRGKWAVVWTDAGRTRRQSLGTSDSQIAEIAFREYQSRLTSARPDGPLTCGAILDAYFKAKEGVFPRPALRAFFASYLPQQVTADAARAYLKQRAGLAPSTVRTELGILNTALHWAWKQRWIERQPSLELPDPSPPRERWLTEDEFQRLVAACRAPHVRLFVILAIHTAARSGALLGLTWDRVTRFIDFEDGRPRTRKRRAVVPINEVLRVELDLARAGAVTDFVIEYGGERVGSVKKAFERAARRAGLDDVTPHTLRHTAATWMAMDGVPMERIAAYLGHRDTKMVERVYAKYHPDYLRDAAETFVRRGRLVQLNQITQNTPRNKGRKRKIS